MTLLLRWTDTDVAAAHWVYLMNRPWRLLRYFRYSVVAILVSVVVLVQYPESWQLVGALILFDAGVIAYQLLLSQRTTNLRFKKSRLWQDGVSVNIDGAGIHVSGPDFRASRQWSEFSEAVESKRVFMFVRAGNKTSFVPKSGMDESQIAQLRTFVSTYVKGKVKLQNALA